HPDHSVSLHDREFRWVERKVPNLHGVPLGPRLPRHTEEQRKDCHVRDATLQQTSHGDLPSAGRSWPALGGPRPGTPGLTRAGSWMVYPQPQVGTRLAALAWTRTTR